MIKKIALVLFLIAIMILPYGYNLFAREASITDVLVQLGVLERKLNELEDKISGLSDGQDAIKLKLDDLRQGQIQIKEDLQKIKVRVY